MGYVKFTESGRSFAAKVSLTKFGMISFNEGSKRRFQMSDYCGCFLYYDADAAKIGIELTNEKSAEGFRPIRFRNSTGCDVAARSFVDYFDIKIQSTVTFDASMDQESGMIELVLEKGRERKEVLIESDSA